MVDSLDGSGVDHGVQNVTNNRGSPDEQKNNFDGNNVDHVEAVHIVQNFTKNKLFEIFKVNSNININNVANSSYTI